MSIGSSPISTHREILQRFQGAFSWFDKLSIYPIQPLVQFIMVLQNIVTAPEWRILAQIFEDAKSEYFSTKPKAVNYRNS